MDRKDRHTLKSYFQKGDVPTEEQFASLVAENQPKKDPSQMDGQENEIVKIFSALLPEQQEQAKKYLRYLLDTQEKTSL